jgi:hypothetical protein
MARSTRHYKNPDGEMNSPLQKTGGEMNSPLQKTGWRDELAATKTRMAR